MIWLTLVFKAMELRMKWIFARRLLELEASNSSNKFLLYAVFIIVLVMAVLLIVKL